MVLGELLHIPKMITFSSIILFSEQKQTKTANPKLKWNFFKNSHISWKIHQIWLFWDWTFFSSKMSENVSFWTLWAAPSLISAKKVTYKLNLDFCEISEISKISAFWRIWSSHNAAGSIPTAPFCEKTLIQAEIAPGGSNQLLIAIFENSAKFRDMEMWWMLQYGSHNGHVALGS